MRASGAKGLLVVIVLTPATLRGSVVHSVWRDRDGAEGANLNGMYQGWYALTGLPWRDGEPQWTEQSKRSRVGPRRARRFGKALLLRMRSLFAAPLRRCDRSHEHHQESCVYRSIERM